MDPFTANILARARERQKVLQGHSNLEKENNANSKNTPPAQNRSETRVSAKISDSNSNSEGTPSPQTTTKTLNIQKENFNMEIKVSSTDNVRLEVEIEERDDLNSPPDAPNNKNDQDDPKTTNELREKSKNRLKRLGQLYSDEPNISSPIHKSEDTFHVSPDVEAPKEPQGKNTNRRGLKRLADLAENINKWEDVTPAPVSAPKSAPKGQAPGKSPVKSVLKQVSPQKSPIKGPFIKSSSDNAEKSLKLNNSVLKSLEQQGFKRTDASLTYKYGGEEKKVPQNEGFVKAKLKKLENNESSVGLKQTKVDPALLSLSERKALFERNKGAALVPKAAFGMAAPVPKSPTKPQKPQKLESPLQSPVKKRVNFTKPIENSKEVPQIEHKEVPQIERKNDSPSKSAPKAAGIANTVAALFEKKAYTISQQQIESSTREQRQKEMDMLLNRFNKNKPAPQDIIEEQDEYTDTSDYESPQDSPKIPQKNTPIVTECRKKTAPQERRSGGKRYSESPKINSILEDVKRIKVSPPKAGRMYPNLSDIEATTETENDENFTRSPSPYEDNLDSSISFNGSEDCNTSFGRDILQAVCQKSPQKSPKQPHFYAESTTSDNSEMDDYIDGAILDGGLLEHNKTTVNNLEVSESFNYKSYNSPKKDYQSPLKFRPRVSVEMPTVKDGDKDVTLTHTVSFYRKQMQAPKSPSKVLVRKPDIIEEEKTHRKADAIIQSKIKLLDEEILRQQNMISQSSQAINLCNITPEFMGSTEHVEAERVLLLATHKRQVILNEIQRLNIEGTLRPKTKNADSAGPDKGILTISNMELPLKNEYVRALAAAGGKGHHVVCLIKCGEEVEATNVVSTVATNLKDPEVVLQIPGTVKLQNVYSDCAITFEVYCLQAQEELLPHDVKYHIHSSKKLITKLTPRKNKQENRLQRPIKESPGGPQAVRTSTFALMGYIVFSAHASTRKSWSLINAPSMSPLAGSVDMKIKLKFEMSVEHRGFLTMFEDVSGFGAWHRRWCLLKGHTLSYWKYPDDENKKAPIETIDLLSCINSKVGPVSRDICARLNTFLFETERPSFAHDKETLVTLCKGDKTIIRHLLSADSKEERDLWISKFNSVLKLLK